MYKLLTTFIVSIAVTVSQAETDMSAKLVGCINANSSAVNSADKDQSLLAVSNCLSGFVTELTVKIEESRAVKTQNASGLIADTSFQSSFTRQATEDSGSGDNVYYGASAGTDNTGSWNTGIGYGALAATESAGIKNTAIG